MTDPVDDIDPTTATTQADLARCLRRLRARSGNISYRELESWGKEHDQPLPRTTLLEVLHGRRFPKKTFLLALVEACGVDPAADTRWERAWNRINESELAEAPVSPAPPTAAGGMAGYDPADDDTDDDTEPAIPTGAWEEAQRLLDQARVTARGIVSAARAEADGVLARARTEADAIRSAAERDGEQLIQAAREQARQEAEAITREATDIKEAALADLAARLDELERHPPAAGGGGDQDRSAAEGRPGRLERWFGR
jgi:hypothetical protein